MLNTKQNHKTKGEIKKLNSNNVQKVVLGLSKITTI